MKIIATIEARMTSSRLPGKVLLPAANKPLLQHLTERLKLVNSIDDVVLATTSNETDDVLVEFANQLGIKFYRGSEDDVMGRVIGAAESLKADIIVEITGDCPIIDHQIVEQTIQMFLAHNVDYVSNCHLRGYPIGMDTQVFLLDTLKRSAGMTSDILDHEHVTLHIRNNPEFFSKVHLVPPPELNWPDLGLTLDEPADYLLIKKIVEYFYSSNPMFSCLDIIKLLKENPDWILLNREVQRKGDS